MTQTPSLRPDARLVQLHAERGDPAARLAQALADLEETDWGLLLSGQVALARQLVALLGPGTLRVDGRLGLNRGAMAEAGLAVADLHGDLNGARAAWLLEPDEAVLERARRAGVRVIVDGTLAPGGAWPARSADYVVYTDAVTLSGYADVPMAALFGLGQAPEVAAAGPSDLSVSLVLRDIATLPLRLARAARTVNNLTERLGSSARAMCPTALLLPPDAAADTVQPLGGMLSAARHVPEGLVLTPGLEDTDRVLALLRSAPVTHDGAADATANKRFMPETPENERGLRAPGEERFRRSSDEARAEANTFTRRDRDDRRERRFERRPERQRRPDQFRPDQARPDQTRPDQARPDQAAQAEGAQAQRSGGSQSPQVSPPSPSATSTTLERFTFDVPQAGRGVTPSEPAEIWEPEIVFSDLAHAPPPLTHTVSSGPDAPDDTGILPEAFAQAASAPLDPEDAYVAPLPEHQKTRPERKAARVKGATGNASAAAPEVVETVANLAPDLPATPAGKEDPAADLSAEQAVIYARLRDWRNAEAKRQEISRFIIASNASLAEIARRVPYTLEDLAAVKGMGKARLEKYGQKILEVVQG